MGFVFYFFQENGESLRKKTQDQFSIFKLINMCQIDI